MDGLTKLIADYSANLTFAQLPEDVVREATLRAVDSIGCAIAGYDSTVARIALALAERHVPDRYPGRILGVSRRSTAEAAAFVNTAMIRNLDFNDRYPGGHPSDCLGALLALVESTAADGRRLMASMVVAYEVFVRLSEAAKLSRRGWDQGHAVGIAAAAGAGNLLGLPADGIAQAVAIAAVGNVPLRATRSGRLTLWKNAATAYAVRNTLFAVLLAMEGMEGPDRPFEGRHGLWDQITGPFELTPFATAGEGRFLTPLVQMKFWPVETNAQPAVWAALELRSEVALEDLTEINVFTSEFAWHEIGSEPEKWDPRTRETADHSLPYIFIKAMLDGTINAASFNEASVLEPSLRPWMAKVRVQPDRTMDERLPTMMMRVVATTRAGGRHEVEIVDPLGHPNNPMQEHDVRAKFLTLAEPVLGVDRARTALDRWLNLPQLQDLSAALDLLEVESLAFAH